MEEGDSGYQEGEEGMEGGEEDGSRKETGGEEGGVGGVAEAETETVMQGRDVRNAGWDMWSFCVQDSRFRFH